MADMLLDYSTIEYSKNLLKRRTLKWLEDLKDQLSTPTDNVVVEKAMADLERKRGNLIDLYTDGLITKAEFKSKSVELDTELEKQKALLEAQEVNPDIKAIEDTIANIDEEIEALYENQTMVEEKKIQFITEHIKKIIVLSNNDIFVTLDRVAGAVLFIDKTDTRFHVVPMNEYDSEELSRVGIAEEEIVPFDRESMSFPNGRIRLQRHDQQKTTTV